MQFNPNNFKIARKDVSPNRPDKYITLPIPSLQPLQLRSPVKSNKPLPSTTSRDSRCMDSILDEELITNINCMNCQNLVPITEIEEHSKICTTVPEAIVNLELESYLSQIQYKIRKLHTCLVEVHKSHDLRPGDKNYISIFCRLCEKTLEGNCMEETDSVMKSLSSLLVSFKGSLGIRVYADRLQALVKEQKVGFQEQELERLKEQTEVYKSRAQVLQKSLMQITPANKINMLTKKLNEINSDVGTFLSGSSELTAMSGVEEEKHDLEGFDTQNNANDGEKDLKKLFYSMCLSIKLRNVGKKSMQDISVQKMYDEALEKKVVPDDWPEFIVTQLKNPMRFSEGPRGRRRGHQKPGGKQLYFESIVEEGESEV